MPIRARTKKPHNCDNIHLSISEYEVTHGFIFLHLNEAFLSFADYFITSIIQLQASVFHFLSSKNPLPKSSKLPESSPVEGGKEEVLVL